MEDREELEHIPWSELRAEQPDGRRRLAYLAAAAIAAVGLGALIARAVAGPAPVATVATGTTAPAAPGTSVAVTTTPVTFPPATRTSVPEEPPVVEDPPDSPLYSEADLMAVPQSSPAMAAITRAERFVVDYFTSDLEPGGSGDVRAALAQAVELPPMPQEGGRGLSYVEWADAYAVRDLGDGVYEIDVLFVVLAAAPDSGFARFPARAVTVRVSTNERGGTVVMDLPEPAVVPVGPEVAPGAGQAAEPTEEVIVAVTARIPPWASEPRVHSASYHDGDWRVVVTVADEVGTRWPLTIVVSAPPPA